MKLPEIPDGARQAGADALAYPLPVDDRHEQRAATVLAAAWPHLYAAALRHVADDLEARHCSFAGLTYLRVLADDAVATSVANH